MRLVNGSLANFLGAEVPRQNWPRTRDLTLVVEKKDRQSDFEDCRLRDTCLPLGQHWRKRAEEHSSLEM